MLLDEHSPIELIDGPSTPVVAAPVRRSRRRALVLILGLMALGVLSIFAFSTGNGMNLETGSGAETTAPDSDDTGDDATAPAGGEGTLVVRTPDAITPEAETPEAEISEEPEPEELEPEAETTLESARSTETTAAESTTVSSSSTTAGSNSNTTAAVRPTPKTSADERTGQGSATTARRTETTQRSTTTQRSSTSKRPTTTQQSAATQRSSTSNNRPTTTQPATSTTRASSTTERSATTQRSTTTAGQTTTTKRSTTTAQQTSTTRQTTTTQRVTTTTAPVPVNGSVVWVDSRAGGGGDGSQARPFRTIIEGILAVRAGETLMVKGGEYREHVNPGYRMPKGTSSSRITMTNAPGERVVIKGRVILTDMDYWTISGINVTWDSERNDRSVEHMIIMNGGVDWEWRDSEIWGAKAFSAMLITKGPRNFTVRNNHFHDTYRTNDTNQDHLIYCSCGTGGGTIERNLMVGSANGRAVKVGSSSNSGGAIGNVKIRYNTMVDNFGPSNIQLSFNTSNITIERNLMVGTQDYAENISTYKLTGSGSRAANNLGFKSPGVLENTGAISDGGGNIHRDPRLGSNYVPQDGTAKAFGHKAP